MPPNRSAGADSPGNMRPAARFHIAITRRILAIALSSSSS